MWRVIFTLAVIASCPVAAQTKADREAYARDVEINFLEHGMDATVRVVGKDGKTLRTRYILIDRPWVYSFTTTPSVVQTLNKKGFTTIVLTDGYDKTWTIKVKDLK